MDVAIFEMTAGLSLAERIARFASVKTLLDAAAKGELLAEDEDFKPIQMDPDLWELRWSFGSEEWRMYHAEPPTFPSYIVALHFHLKDLGGTDSDIRTNQNREIGLAAKRYMLGRPSTWGIT